MSRLDVNPGETYTVHSGTTEEWAGADVDGTLDVDGHLKLVDNPDVPTQEQGGFRVGETGIDLPLSPLNLSTMETGIAIFLSSVLALLLGAAAVLRNYVAGVFWAFAVFALLASGLFNVGLELFWAIVIATAFILAAGMVARWSAA